MGIILDETNVFVDKRGYSNWDFLNNQTFRTEITFLMDQSRFKIDGRQMDE